MSLGLLLAALMVSSGAPIAQEATGRVEAAPMAVPAQDPALAAATAQARATLDGFLAMAKAPPPGTDQFKLKVVLRDGARVEHVWVMPFRPTADGFEGVLANEPSVVWVAHIGQRIRFSRDQVSDWGYARDGRQVGSFTVCALMSRLPPAQAEHYRRDHGYTCGAER